MVLLVDILEGFLGEHRKHNEDTGQIAFDCPACSEMANKPDGDGKGNLEINYERGIFKCWVCAETNHMYGPVIKLLKKYATPTIIRNYLLVKPETDLQLVKEHGDIIVTLPDEYLKLSRCTAKDFKSQEAKQYLYDRGITDAIIEEFSIGYCYKGPHFNRIIIPSYDVDGKLNYFVARWFSQDPNKLKYLNPVAEKQEIIFNEKKVNWDATIYLVEGATDHIVTPNSIPLLGKFLPNKLLELLHDKAKGYIVIVLDDDAYTDAVRLYHELNIGDLRGRIKICKMPDGYDPSEIYKNWGPQGMLKYLSKSYKLSDD